MKPEELKKYRDQIDEVDDQLIKLLVKRAGYVKQVGERKKLANLPEKFHKFLVLCSARATLQNGATATTFRCSREGKFAF